MFKRGDVDVQFDFLSLGGSFLCTFTALGCCPISPKGSYLLWLIEAKDFSFRPGKPGEGYCRTVAERPADTVPPRERKKEEGQ